MHTSLIITFIAGDRPGLVEHLSRVVTEHEGNWLESRMTQLAGQFAGIARVSLPEGRTAELRKALAALQDSGLDISVHDANDAPRPANLRQLFLGIIGPDRPGIVREVSAALSGCGINVAEMSTRITSAPMSAEALFEAEAEIQVPRELDLEQLNRLLDDISDRLDIDIDLEEALRR